MTGIKKLALVFALLFLAVFIASVFFVRHHLELIGIFMMVAAGFLIGRSMAQRIEKLKQTAEQLAKEELTLKSHIAKVESEKIKASAILENLTEGVMAVTEARQVVSINPAAADLFHISQGSAIGKSLVEVVRSSELEELMKQAIAESKIITEELELSGLEDKIIRVSAVGIRQGDVGGILVLRDITEVRRLENIRRDFVANVSHELRTPLTSIKGFIETLLSGAMKDPQRSEGFLKIMEEDANRLTRLIDDTLELSRIESKAEAMQFQPEELGEIVENVIPMFLPRLREKSLQIKNNLAQKKLPRVLADRDKIKQVLINLMDNAIKYNQAGGKIILDGQQLNKEVQMTISDTGIGVSQEDLPRLFERFYSVDKARSREQGGTGLGLAIVKHIIEAHRGRVFCESRLGSGSTFSFTLPIV